jgi:hypothetical protein
MGVMHQVPGNIAGLCVLFGVLWGFGGLTYGLTMRYLGLSLGMAVVLGLCTVFGTLIPPIVQGDFAEKLLNNASGRIILLGLLITLAGIVVVALAGARKDAALSEDAKKAVIAEFDFKKGVAVAIFSGIMSACFAFGLAAGEPIKALSAAAGTGPLWTGLPVLCLVMFGGLLTNGVWCGFLIVRNKSAGQWLGRVAPRRRRQRGEAAAAAGQLPALRPGRHRLVLPVLLLHDGRKPDGQVRLLQLDPAHGLDHHLRHRLGLCPARVEGRPPGREGHRLGRHRPADPGHHRHRLRQQDRRRLSVLSPVTVLR